MLRNVFLSVGSAPPLLQYFVSLLLIFCVELASGVWTYDEVVKHSSCSSSKALYIITVFLY